MSKLAQIGVTQENLECLDLLKQSGYFDELQDAARFAAALSIKKRLYEGKELSKVGKNLHTRWNTSLVDPDGFFREYIKINNLCDVDSGIGLRSLIIIGLDYIYSKIKDDPDLILISKVLK